MKYKSRKIENHILKILRKPGIIQVFFGFSMAFILILFSFFSESYNEHVLEKRAEQGGSAHAIDYVNEPPALTILRKYLAPAFSYEVTRDSENKNVFELEVFPMQQEQIQNFHSFHLFGTDQLGRDILVNLMRGSKIACWGSLLAILTSLLIGLPAGILSGYYGGIFERTIGYVMSLIRTLPRLIILIIIIATLGFDFVVIMITIGILASTKIMEIVQNKIQLFKENQFIESARELGIPDYKVIFKHILWYNTRAVIFIQVAYEIAEVILLETSLSYIGWGVQDQISWGNMVSNGMAYINNQQYWMLFFPSITIIISISAFVLIADGLSKYFNIRWAQ